MPYGPRSDDRRYWHDDERRESSSNRRDDHDPPSSTPQKRSEWRDGRAEPPRSSSPRRDGRYRDSYHSSVERPGRWDDTADARRSNGWGDGYAGGSNYRMRSPRGSQRPEHHHSSGDSDYTRRYSQSRDTEPRAQRSPPRTWADRGSRRDETRHEPGSGYERRQDRASHLRSPGRGGAVDMLDYGGSRQEESASRPPRRSPPRTQNVNGKNTNRRDERYQSTDRPADVRTQDRRWRNEPYTTQSPPVRTLKRKGSPQTLIPSSQNDAPPTAGTNNDEERSAKRPVPPLSVAQQDPSSESAASDIRHTQVDSAAPTTAHRETTNLATSYSSRQYASDAGEGISEVQTTMLARQCAWPFEMEDVREHRLRRKDRPTLKPLNERRFLGCSSIDQYDVGVKLGQGTFGEVKKATHFLTGVEVALKKVTVHEEKDGMPITAIREIKLLKRLHHPAIVPIIDMAYRAPTERGKCGEVYMVEPYMDHDLNGMLENQSIKLNMSQIKLYMKQLFEGTLYLHQNKILHRDMKAANLLINNKGQLQIADFGLARPYHDPGQAWAPSGWKGGAHPYTGMVVTRWYRPPELLAGERRYGPPIDMWGLGCILAEMIVKQPLFKGSSEIDQMLLISKLCGSPNDTSYPGWSSLPGVKNADPSGRPDQEPDLAGQHDFGSFPRRVVEHFTSGNIIISSDMADLLDKLLVLDPKRRMTAQEALEHRWFWQSPFPADPNAMPQYQASKELDRQRRDQQKRLAQQQYQHQQRQAQSHIAPPPPQMQQHHGAGGGGYPAAHHHLSSRQPPGAGGQYPRSGPGYPNGPHGKSHGDHRAPYPRHPPPTYGRSSQPPNPYRDL